ncbi:DUF92 domain-containing protein [Alkalihalophilus marmarensis]|jgi:uncharacterized protein (TIGR00297 family)|uniref:TIGR00297 family protein n=1 Tax=Alkalihalophilus marmarensis DSM 21297 TaxID=1188261 RepID=U6SV98_9BACI|nr:DUF92 domain-containing protein [Alkalihalophilus marmarensis]ERN54815.1 hypothetical protein A33I_05570 [Alkalihalophilus marmarensis DSM 21297]MCM3488566.1 DUF92 domain-containing protein [Alkalihalophilus marmarensis]MEC2070528.1 DUF92 domain-containing protein [Alkalihalophilus marmarensis]
MAGLYIGVVLLAAAAYYLKKLTVSGAVAAVVVGWCIAFGLGFYGLMVLAIFFITSSMWSSLWKGRKASDVTEKGDRRDAWQVAANGGVAALMALFYGFNPSPIWIFAFVSSLAAANADTWASEIGTLSRQRPLHILTWKRVEPGTSGAITALGSAAAFAGSFLISVFAILGWWSAYHNSHVLLIALTVVGFLGNIIDTLVGASFQVLYKCRECGIETEATEHCGSQTEYMSGLRWLNNDVVNIACTASGALLGIGVAWLLL